MDRPIKHTYEFFLSRIAHTLLGYKGRHGQALRQVSKTFDFSVTSLQRIIKKEKSISFFDFWSIANALEMSLSEFSLYLQKDGAVESYNSPWLNDIYHTLKNLNDDERKGIVETLVKPYCEIRKEKTMKLISNLSKLSDKDFSMINYLVTHHCN